MSLSPERAGERKVAFHSLRSKECWKGFLDFRRSFVFCEINSRITPVEEFLCLSVNVFFDNFLEGV